MKKRLGSLAIVLLMLLVPLAAFVGLSLVYAEVGMAKEIGIQEPVLEACDVSLLPQAVVDDAARVAGQVKHDDQEAAGSLKDQLLAMYAEASKLDIVIIFNSGGLGWNLTTETPGWQSILQGMKDELESFGYRTEILNYRRTGEGFRSVVGEILEAIRRYPNKAPDLAFRVQFLTDHLPDLKIIVAGESTGTVISDKTMELLKDKSQVYSVQTGMPFWHKPNVMDRTLLVNSNGKGEDTFSYGNVPAMLWTTFKGWIGLASPDENPGNILSWLRAPGHHYSWQYPGVYDEIIKFLQSNFEQ